MNRLPSIHITPQWNEPREILIPDLLRSGVKGSDLLLKALVQRGIQDSQTASAFLDFHLYSPASPFDFPGMQQAVERIIVAIRQKHGILVWGDFDVDGQTSTAVLVSGLRAVGADVQSHIPVRAVESHGVKLDSLKKTLSPEIRLVITCDTGIAAHDAAQYLRDLSIDLIITDHHTLPETLPPALSIINPHLLPANHPMCTLSGVGVAYELIQAIYERMGNRAEASALHDLVALGTVADLASLTGDNRFLVQSGIDHLRRTPRFCIEKMAEAAGFALDQITEEQISYYLAPRLNAVGRLEDANPLVEFLLSNDPVAVEVLVERMEGLNAQRKLLVNQVFQGCLAQIDRDPSLLDRPLLILSHPEWPGGVVGIAASRLVEITHKPVILLNSSSPELARGSARSVEGIDITAALSSNQKYLNSFGGHAMAAGLSIKPDQFEDFRRGMEKTIAEAALINQVSPILEIDAFQDLNQVSMDLIHDLDRLAPFGPGNPPLIFAARNLKLLNTVEIGRNGDHLQVTVEDLQGNAHRFLWWQGAGSPLPDGLFDVAYTARINQFRGENQLQLEWVDFRPAAEPPVIELRRRKHPLQFEDYRAIIDTSELAGLPDEVSIFCEGKVEVSITGCDRFHIQPANHLVILSIPPSPDVLQNIVKQVQPEKLTFYGFIPRERNLTTYLAEFAAWLKVQKDQAQIASSLENIASQFSVTTPVVRSTLEWFASKGKIGYLINDQGCITFTVPVKPDPAAASRYEAQIIRQFDEIAAYQRHYLSAPLEALVESGEK